MLEDNWWQRATIYQIYPRSFADSNGDGIGDLNGIIAHLDHLEDLGIGAIWLSPIFASPMRDNGYDISDYQAIAPEFGTLADFDRLIAEAKARNNRIILDLVVNHSSNEHRWFKSASAGRDAPYRDYYIWRDPAPDGGVPSDLQSAFGGPAWTLDPASGQYYLHQFAPEQPDLNWENPKLRAEVYAMMNWWLDRGVAGFRMDVIDLIGKEPDRGITSNGPHLHDYLQEMHKAALDRPGLVTVGETWSAAPSDALLYSGRDRGELSMVFQFEQVLLQMDEVFGKWRPKPFDLIAFKQVFFRWQAALAEDGWNSLFWSNHDLPRAVSRYGDDKRYHIESAKMLATVLHLMKGTPYVYQGEELAMTNMVFTDMDQLRDIEALNMHDLSIAQGMSEAEFIAGANENGRDNARTPMQWTASENAGFTTGTPWIDVNPNHVAINAASERASETSVFAHYRKLIGLRAKMDVIAYGAFEPHLEDHEQIFAYSRVLGDERIVVVANFSGQAATADLAGIMAGAGEPLIWNYEPVSDLSGRLDLKPYEAFAVHFSKGQG